MKDLPCIGMALCYGEEAYVGLGDPSPKGLRMTVGVGMRLCESEVAAVSLGDPSPGGSG